MFPQMQSEAIKVLDGSLKFDPRKRLSVEEALNDPFFSECRRKDLEVTRETITM
jgi:serine/threonine protein kinase